VKVELLKTKSPIKGTEISLRLPLIFLLNCIFLLIQTKIQTKAKKAGRIKAFKEGCIFRFLPCAPYENLQSLVNQNFGILIKGG